MKVAILNAIDPAKSQVNWGGSPIDAYIRFLQNAPDDFAFTGYTVALNQFPADPDLYDGYVITGSPSGAYETDPWILTLMTFIRQCYHLGKKLVGICFGHQIIAQALGGHVEKSAKGWGLGLKPFAVNSSKPWMTEPSPHCSLYFVHQDQVIDLPPGAEQLAGNDFCPNVMYAIGEQVLGVQGHPEFTPEIMEGILASRNEMENSEVYETAVASVANGRPDNQLFAQWIVNFLQE
ncbi:glutamine amidotransferase-related protein [Candidatus Leptofilum sp.]|uniref:glutamine amidotransferase-related protein n=1 Tax=Candidatus Leptofilum sp. TaxID=3241576 RepID=UPI003B5A3D0A